jgi:hypothetical protein
VFRPDSGRGSSRGAEPGEVCGNWDAVRDALAVVGPTAVAKRMGLTPQGARHWAAGTKQPHDPRKVVAAIVALAAEAGLSLPINDRLSKEAICAELPGRAAAVQCFVTATVALFVAHQGGVRELARAIEVDEKTVRRWLALARGELRPIRETNSIIAKLAKFARSEIRAARRRITTVRGPEGDREAILACLSLVHGTETPAILSPAETLAFPAVLCLGALLAVVVRATSGVRAFARQTEFPA